MQEGDKAVVGKIAGELQSLLDKTNIFDKIATRSASDKTLGKLHIFDEGKLQRIADNMPEINRATRSFGRKNTQTTNRLMTLTMLADASPYRVLRQCLAQIERKRGAIKENRFSLLKDKIKLEKMQDELNKLISGDECSIYDVKLKEIEIQEIIVGISDGMLYVEGALKEIASFQSSYMQICKNKNIPKNWDETHAEEYEVRSHLRLAFLHAYRDLMAHGRLGMGTLEYLQQFGVHPHVAGKVVDEYISSTEDQIGEGHQEPDYEHLERFLDAVEERFKDNYKQVLKRIGLDNLYEDWYMYVEDPDKK